MGLARQVPLVAPAAEVAATFEVVARTVRLVEFLAKPRRARAHKACEPNMVDERMRDTRREARDSDSGGRSAGLEVEALDRLEAPEALEAIEHGRPIDEVIVDIRHDLELAWTAHSRRRRTVGARARRHLAKAPRDVASAIDEKVASFWRAGGAAGGRGGFADTS